MKNSPNSKDIISALLKNSIVQFVAGVLSLLVILKTANAIDYKLIQVVLKSFGYGFFCYLTTPFIIYWLAYASEDSKNFKKLGFTVVLISFYSYIIWDAYFFFRGTMASWFSVIN